MKIKEIIVVEGQNDTMAIQRAVDADTIETRGSAVPAQVLSDIKQAQQKRGVIIFTDPDYVGERIRRMISRSVPNVKHAFLPQNLAKGKRNVGVEYASPESIQTALSHVCTEEKKESVAVNLLSFHEYVDRGFVGNEDSKWLREEVARYLNLGYGNAKQFYRRLCMFHISKQEIDQAVKQVRKEQGK